MSEILFVVELGGGFGHARRLLPIARAAHRRGHRPLFLVPNTSEVVEALEGEPFEVRRAPSLPRRWEQRSRAVVGSFADILGMAGFDEQALVAAMVRAWRAVLEEVRPAAVVSEFSPFLALAMFGGPIPLLSLGYGFVLPPPHLARFPVLVPGSELHSQDALLGVVRSVARASTGRAPTALPALFGGTVHFVTGLAELDPYRASRLQPPVGPPGVPSGFSAPESEELFAYLLGDAANTLPILKALARSRKAGRVYVRKGTPEQQQAVAGTQLSWLERPVAIEAALRRARLVVHHGSMLTAEEALLGGRPQLVFPLYLEHLFTARALLDLGVGHCLAADTSAESLDSAVERAWNDPAAVASARAFSVRRHAEAEPDLSWRLLQSVLSP